MIIHINKLFFLEHMRKVNTRKQSTVILLNMSININWNDYHLRSFPVLLSGYRQFPFRPSSNIRLSQFSILFCNVSSTYWEYSHLTDCLLGMMEHFQSRWRNYSDVLEWTLGSLLLKAGNHIVKVVLEWFPSL